MGSSSSETTPKSNSSASQCRGASASYAAVGSHSGVGSRLSGIESMEEVGRGEEEGEEEEEEEESPKELELEEEEMAMAGEGLGFCAIGFGRKKEFSVKKSRFRVKLNSEKMGDGSAVSRSTRSQLQRRCVFLGGYSVFNEH